MPPPCSPQPPCMLADLLGPLGSHKSLAMGPPVLSARARADKTGAVLAGRAQQAQGSPLRREAPPIEPPCLLSLCLALDSSC